MPLKNLSKALVFILLICSSLTMHGQDWLDGFVVLRNQDTLRGQVQYKTSDAQFEKSIFRKDGVIAEYSPLEILGYGIDGIKSYSSQALGHEFAEIVAIGNVSLFKQRKTFLIQNEAGETFPLVSKTKTVVKDGEVYVSEGKKWKSVLFGMLSSCGVSAEELKDLNFNQKNLLELIGRYNTCKNGETALYSNSGLRKVLVDFGVHIGRRSGELNVSNAEGVPRPVDTNHKSTNIVFGGFTNFRFPNFSEKISLQVGLNYQTVNLTGNTFFDNTNNPNRFNLVIDRYQTISEFNSLGIPISFKGLLVDGAISVYVQTGIVFNQITNASSLLTQERTINNGAPTITETQNVLDFKSSTSHAWGRIGLSKSINGKYKISLAFDLIFANDQALLNTDKFSPFKQSGVSLILSY